jgi:DNA-binding response OmpR family regulator
MTAVLVIEDDSDLREMLETLLRRAGYRVSAAENGRDGMRVVRDESIDIVVTDILMPVQEGIETIAELKRRYPKVRVIAMSGGGIVQPEDYLQTAELFGAEMTISKPFEPGDLLQALRFLASVTH